MSPRELEQGIGSGSVDPRRIRTVQASISPHFSNEQETPLSQGVRTLKKDLEFHVDPIRVFSLKGHPHLDNGVYTLDHRRLYTHRKAKLPIRYEQVEADEAHKERFKFSSHNSGMSMKVATRPIPFVEHTGYGEPEPDGNEASDEHEPEPDGNEASDEHEEDD